MRHQRSAAAVLPKGTDLSEYSQAQLNKVARQLDERPRKSLGFATPAERFNACVASTRAGTSIADLMLRRGERRPGQIADLTINYCAATFSMSGSFHVSSNNALSGRNATNHVPPFAVVDPVVFLSSRSSWGEIDVDRSVAVLNGLSRAHQPETVYLPPFPWLSPPGPTMASGTCGTIAHTVRHG
jgi:hypothetical protein